MSFASFCLCSLKSSFLTAFSNNKLTYLHSLCTGRLESTCTESMDRARRVIDDMIQQTFVELETGGNVRFEYGKSSDAW